jgi:hypothetical protein
MAGIVTYEIAAAPDRAFELSKFVASAIGVEADILMQALGDDKNFEAFVVSTVDRLGAVARASSDDGWYFTFRLLALSWHQGDTITSCLP